ncbi:hypothetical protein GBAR_LOCUS25576 [Geodia barretti]|uniref:Uncharacterized protein n=1 Tax=Geodia barretti TaxID=519541 RepID=A0AA35XBD8_GEOBA|nr:hypothetical protein GBAR_LOCUS25576 [Geodia barretti]
MADKVTTAEARKGEEEEGGREEGEGEDGACSDQELEDLLNFSLGEFGKHLPATATDAPESQSTHPPPSDSGCGSGRSQGESEEKSGSSEAPPTATMQEFEDVFSEEFVAQAQAKLDKAMQILSKEDPELWQQLKGFSDAASASLGCTEGEERGREAESGRDGGEEGGRREY